MTLRTIAFLLAAAFAAPAAAQCTGANLIETLPADRRAALEAAVSAAPYPEGNVWRAEKPGSTVHVVGTIHLPDPRLDPIIEQVRPFVRDADLLVLEATTAMQAELQQKIAADPEIAFLTDGPSLIDLLGEETWDALSPQLAARGLPPFMAAKFRPWFLALTLSIPHCAMEAITSGRTGLDGRLEEVATANGVPLATLDDIEALLAILSEGTLEEQLDMLRMTAAMDEDGADALATTLDSYFAGRHRELWEFSRLLAEDQGIDGATFATFETRLLDDRNADWETQLPGLIDGKSVVIAVGSAHLAGETGMLRAMERMGYTLTRL